MFNFLLDMGNYEERKVGRWESDDGKTVISTAKCSDGKQPFETGIMHPDYREDGGWVIVAAYNSKQEATIGHAEWVKLIETNTLPDPLIDVCNADIASFAKEVYKDWQTEYPRKK